MNVLRSIFLRREAGIAVMIVLFCLAVGAVKPQFLTLDQLRIILLLTPLIMIGAMGQMLVIVARHVDLSIGSMLGFSAMVSGMLYRFDATWFGFDVPWWTGIPLSIAVGAVLGLVNGAADHAVPAAGDHRDARHAQPLSRPHLHHLQRQADRPAVHPVRAQGAVADLADPRHPVDHLHRLRGRDPDLSSSSMHTRVGRQIFALGSNPVAAPLRGIKVTQVTLLVFAISGALSGLAGILYASRWGFVNPSNTGTGFEFQVIAAVVIGGVSINGGVGTVLGTVLGVLLLGCVAAALPLLGIPGTSQAAIYGAVILVALVIDRTVRQQGIVSLKRARA